MVVAAILEDVEKLRVVDYPEPQVESNGILLKTELCGVCGTDMHLYGGNMVIPFPVIPGHEFVGTIEEIGDEAGDMEVKGQPLAEGDRITVVPGTNRFCGDCYFCRFMPHKPTLCTNRKVLGVNMTSAEPPHLLGGWAEKIYVDAKHFWVYKVPDEVPPEVALLTEPMAVSSRAFERGYAPGLPTFGEGFGVGGTVAVQGAGAIGLLTVATAELAGAGRIISIDMVDERLEMAERLGADQIIDMRIFKTPEERVREVLRLTGGLGADVVVECVGIPAAVPEGIDMTRRGGKYVEVGHYTDPGPVPINPHTICFKDMDILGSWTYPPTQFGTVLELMRQSMDRLPLDELVTKRYGVAEAQRAMDDLKARKGIKLAIHG
ncbi:MAG: zinc-binding dehydrogenase [Candidatus Bathyarchaeota archaeon]|nr:MAG: zinc-binding dehydrogenase [Candidatus Bathyarchaeota archaeon]